MSSTTPTTKQLASDQLAISQLNSVYFVNSDLDDLATLLAGLPPGAEVHLIEAGTDGVQLLADTLQGRSGIEAIHLLTHGSAGSLQLGSSTLTADTLGGYDAQWATVRAALTDSADLLIYGCDVAAGDVGAAFVSQLASLTGADVAASTDLTGAADQGGNWLLESQTGTIEAAPVVTASYTGVLAAPTIYNLSAATYTENAAAITLDSDISFSGGSNYGGGYMRFSLGSANSSDQLVLAAGSGISISGSSVYNNGTFIGSIDSTRNGQNGADLQINFQSNFTNASFESGTTTGWTIGTSMVDLGVTSIAGFTSPNYSTMPANSGGNNDGDAPSSASYNYAVDGGGSSGTYALRLYSQMTTANGYDTVHGPYAVSSAFTANSSDTLYFDWKAQGGDDDYHVVAYLLNTSSGAATKIIDRTGAGSTSWATASVSVPSTGTYKFVFVSGTYDASGGQAAGASLYIDNVKAFGNTVTDSVLTTLGRLVTYQNTAEDASTARTLTVTAADGSLATQSATATLNVTNANDAPTMNAATLAAVSEDATTPTGATVSALFGSSYADVDNAYTPTNSFAGVAIVGDASTSTQGVWQYSTDGTNWYPVKDVTFGTTAGLLLSDTSKLRFVPAAHWNGTPGALSVHAVDNSGGLTFTSGTTRQTFNTTTDGVTSAVSANAVTLGTSITSVNDAPVFSTGAVTKSVVDTNATDSTPTLTGTITATDSLGGAPSENGTLTYTISGGSTAGGYSTKSDSYGTLSLKTSDGSYTYTPKADAVNALTAGSNPTSSYTISVTDGQGATITQSFTVNHTGANDRPVLTADNGEQPTSYVNLPTIAEDNAVVGQTVANLFAARVTDLDTGASLGGVIVTGNAATAAQGTWQYKIGTGAWQDLPTTTLSTTTGLALSAATSLRFSPLKDYNGTPGKLTVYAADNGYAGGFSTTAAPVVNVNVSAEGISLTAKVMGITITPVNDAPVLTSTAGAATLGETAALDATTSISSGSIGGTLTASDVDHTSIEIVFGIRGGAVSGTTVTKQGIYGTLTVDKATGVWSYAANKMTAINALPAGASVTDPFEFKVTDPLGAVSAQPLVITIEGTNDTPLLVTGHELSDKTITGTAAFNFQLPSDSFTDAEGGNLTYTVSVVDDSGDARNVGGTGGAGALPSWLSFNEGARTFTGTPPTTWTYGPLNLKVTASDSVASATDTFTLTIEGFGNQAPVLAHPVPQQVVTPTLEKTEITFNAGTSDQTLSFNNLTTTGGTPTADDTSITLTPLTAAQVAQAVVTAGNTTLYTVAIKVGSGNENVVVYTAITMGEITNTDYADVKGLGTFNGTAPAITTTQEGITGSAKETFEVAYTTGTSGTTLIFDGKTTTLPSIAVLATTVASDFVTAINANTNAAYTAALKSGSPSIVVLTNKVAGDLTNITNADFSGTYAGINVGTPTSGGWEYTLPANTFTDADSDVLTYSAWVNGTEITTVSDAALRFNATTLKFTGDGTALANGGLVEIRVVDAAGSATTASTTMQFTLQSGTAGVTAVSADALTATWSGAGSQTYLLPTGTFVFTDSGALTFSAMVDTNSDGTGDATLPAWLSIDTTNGKLSGNPPANATSLSIVITASESTGTSSSATKPLTLTIASPNDAPVVLSTLPDVTVAAGDDWNLNVGSGLFSDPDGSVTGTAVTTGITYTAKLADGSVLPSWLSFIGTTFSGNPPAGTPYLNLRVIGTDPGGASASTGFTLNLTNAGSAALAANNIGTVTVTGTPTQGQTLTAVAPTDTDGYTAGTVVYQWQVSSDNFTTATDVAGVRGQAQSLTLAQSEVGLKVRVQAFYNDNGGVAEAPASTAQSVADLPEAGVVTFTATPMTPEETITALLSDADGLRNATPSYQWYRSTTGADGTWTPIADATFASYTMTTDDGNNYLRAAVTYTDDTPNAQEVRYAVTGSKVQLGAVKPVAVDDSQIFFEAGGAANDTVAAPTGTFNVLANDTDANIGVDADVIRVSALRTGAATGVGTNAVDDATTLTLTGAYGVLVITKATGVYTYTVTQTNAEVEALDGTTDTLVDAFNYTVSDSTNKSAIGVLSLTITGAHDNPAITGTLPASSAQLEDVSGNVDLSAIDISDVDSTSVTVKLVASEGTLAASDASGVVVNGTGTATLTLTGTPANVTAYLNTAANVQYTSALNDNGTPGATLTVSYQDSAMGATFTPLGVVPLHITLVNDAPDGAPKTITILEDAPYTFTAADFGFTDVNDTVTAGSTANSLAYVMIKTLPTFSEIQLNGVVVDADAVISVADINANKLKLLPRPDLNDAPLSQFTFQVQDNGGTVNNGVDLDPTPDTLTINVTPVNDAPALRNASTSTVVLASIYKSDTTSAGNLVSDLVRPADGTLPTAPPVTNKSVTTDVDYVTQGAGEAWASGIAIHSTTYDGPAGSGAWQYSVNNGLNWFALDTVSETTALLLRSTDKIRFLPTGTNTISAYFRYYLWDQSTGTAAGTKVSVATRGGITPYSTASDEAAIAVLQLDGTATAVSSNGAGTVITAPPGNINVASSTTGGTTPFIVESVDANAVVGISGAGSTTLDNPDGSLTVNNISTGTVRVNGLNNGATLTTTGDQPIQVTNPDGNVTLANTRTATVTVDGLNPGAALTTSGTGPTTVTNPEGDLTLNNNGTDAGIVTVNGLNPGAKLTSTGSGQTTINNPEGSLAVNNTGTGTVLVSGLPAGATVTPTGTGPVVVNTAVTTGQTATVDMSGAPTPTNVTLDNDGAGALEVTGTVDEQILNTTGSGPTNIRNPAGDLTLANTGTGTVTVDSLSTGATLNTSGTGPTTVANPDGNLSLANSGTGTVTVSGLNPGATLSSSGSGPTQVSDPEGSLTLANTGTGTVTVDGLNTGETLSTSGTGPTTVANPDGDLSLTNAGPGTVTVTGLNPGATLNSSGAGPTNITDPEGSLTLANTGTGTVTVDGLNTGATLSTSGTGPTTVANPDGDLSLANAGPGTVTVSGLNPGATLNSSGAGPTNITDPEGSLTLANTGTGTVTVDGLNTGATLNASGTGPTTVTNPDGDFKISNVGTGTVFVSGDLGGHAVTFDPANTGPIVLNHSGVEAVSIVNFPNDQTLTSIGSGPTTISNPVGNVGVDNDGIGIVTVGNLGDGKKLTSSGSGPTLISNPIGNVIVDNTGTGSVVVTGLPEGKKVTTTGSGATTIETPLGDASVDNTGTGTVTVKGVAPGKTVSTSGDQPITIDAAQGDIKVVNTGSGTTTVTGTLPGKTVSTSGSGPVVVNSVLSSPDTITVHTSQSQTTIDNDGSGTINVTGLQDGTTLTSTGSGTGSTHVVNPVGNLTVNNIGTSPLTVSGLDDGKTLTIPDSSTGAINVDTPHGKLTIDNEGSSPVTVTGVTSANPITCTGDGGVNLVAPLSGATVANNGTGSVNLTDVKDGSTIHSAGSGAGTTTVVNPVGNLTLDNTGSSPLTVTGLDNDKTLSATGTGPIAIDNPHGNLSVVNTGSGMLTLSGVNVGSSVSASGTGPVNISAPDGNVNVHNTGSGLVTISAVPDASTIHCSGSGPQTVDLSSLLPGQSVTIDNDGVGLINVTHVPAGVTVYFTGSGPTTVSSASGDITLQNLGTGLVTVANDAALAEGSTIHVAGSGPTKFDTDIATGKTVHVDVAGNDQVTFDNDGAGTLDVSTATNATLTNTSSGALTVSNPVGNLTVHNNGTGTLTVSGLDNAALLAATGSGATVIVHPDDDANFTVRNTGTGPVNVSDVGNGNTVTTQGDGQIAISTALPAGQKIIVIPTGNDNLQVTNSGSGLVDMQGNLALDDNDSLALTLTANGATLMTQTGTIDLGSAALVLSLAPGYTPALGDTIWLIKNDGNDAVVGTFAGKAEGASVKFGNDLFSISYQGGTDHNDVVLTMIGLALSGDSSITVAPAGTTIQVIDLSGMKAGEVVNIDNQGAAGVQITHLPDGVIVNISGSGPVVMTDSDGSAQDTEDKAPALGSSKIGDGNGDGMADALQSNVASAPFLDTPTAQSKPGLAPAVYVSLVADSKNGKIDTTDDNTATLSNVHQLDAPVSLPAGVKMPLGLIAFVADVGLSGGATGTTETFSLYVESTIGVNGYWKQDANHDWVNLASALYGGQMVAEGGKTRLDFQITDGGAFDDDHVVNGTIVDPGSAGFIALSLVGYAPELPVIGYWF
jgi:VCBS repeat-containing protein